MVPIGRIVVRGPTAQVSRRMHQGDGRAASHFVIPCLAIARADKHDADITVHRRNISGQRTRRSVLMLHTGRQSGTVHASYAIILRRDGRIGGEVVLKRVAFGVPVSYVLDNGGDDDGVARPVRPCRHLDGLDGQIGKEPTQMGFETASLFPGFRSSA